MWCSHYSKVCENNDPEWPLSFLSFIGCFWCLFSMYWPGWKGVRVRDGREEIQCLFFKDSQFSLLPSRASHSTVQQTLMFPVSVLGDNFGLQTIVLLGMQALQCSELKLFIYLPTKEMLPSCRKFPYISVYGYRRSNRFRKIAYVKTNNWKTCHLCSRCMSQVDFESILFYRKHFCFYHIFW